MRALRSRKGWGEPRPRGSGDGCGATNLAKMVGVVTSRSSLPGVQVANDFVCEHGMPKPWATCMDCMMAPPDERPTPPAPLVEPKAAPAKAKAKAKSKAKPGGGASAPRAKRAPAAPSAGRLPRSALDEVPDLVGDKDLAYEIPPDDFAYFTGGPEADWLPISRMPKELRPGGTVYLQIDAELVAQARVRGVGFREQRWDHAAPDVASDLGPGATLELEGGWSGASIDLGPEGAASVTDYRYLVRLADGTVVVAPQER